MTSHAADSSANIMYHLAKSLCPIFMESVIKMVWVIAVVASVLATGGISFYNNIVVTDIMNSL